MKIRIGVATPATFVILSTILMLPFVSRNILLILVALCALLSVNSVTYEIKTIALKQGVSKWLLLYLACYIINIPIAINVVPAIREFAVECIVFLWLIIILGSIKKKRFLGETIIKYYYSSCVIISVIYLLFRLFNINALAWIKNIELVKTDNHFCFYVGGAFVVSFLSFLDRKKFWIFAVMVVVSVIINIATGRGVMVAIIGACLIAYLERSKNSWCRKVFIIISAIGLLAFYQYFQNYLLSITKVFDPTSSFSNRERYQLWTGCLNMFKDNPLGVGGGNWSEIYNSQYKLTINYYPHSHNTYLQHICELGIQGVVCFIGVLICAIKDSLHKYKMSFSKALYSSHILLIYCAISFAFNNPLNNNKPLFLFFTIIAVVIDGLYHPDDFAY